MRSPANYPSDAPYQSHPEGTVSSVATTLASRAPIETGGFVQPEEAAASPNFSHTGSTTVDRVVAGARDTFQPSVGLSSSFAVNRTASFDNVGNASVNNTNASLTTDTSDTDMVDIGNLTIRQNALAHDVGAPGNIVPTPIRNVRVSFVEDLPIALAGLAVTPIDLGHHSELVLKRPPIPIAALDRLPRASVVNLPDLLQ
ncbi:hypothetical protein PSTG_13689 [Puccinia striiformis f. sp. tritici PST-78]|uniref:Uncharacterized protein n=1 Tax=Puccinia striiformis f. sp. tritici PST-78 TaxID=1165861 RepID=A0A0L0V0U5_9BASI|nr:hypothetical protein PSTG_13689 [Puccinia striiformis f. sp. tritici PST-78]